MTVFLATLDRTIAAIAIRTIVTDIGGQSGYSWVGSAYLLSTYLLLVYFACFIDYFFFSSVRLHQPAMANYRILLVGSRFSSLASACSSLVLLCAARLRISFGSCPTVECKALEEAEFSR